MPSDDLKNYATSDTDFYDLLGITFETSQRDIDRAWRKTALKYHPDKVGNDPIAKEKFHLAQIGYDLLSDPVVKVLYDNTRNARLQRKRQNELFEGKRRKMKDDLEARERGVKRAREEDEGDEEKLEREIRRLAEDGKRRRKEREDALKKELHQESTSNNGQSTPQTPPIAKPPPSVSELDLIIKIRYLHTSNPPTALDLQTLFSKFGPIQSTVLLTPKMLKTPQHPKKALIATCMIQYASIIGAHAAVSDFSLQQGPEWAFLDSVSWAAGKEPDCIRETNGAPLGDPRTSSPRSSSSSTFLNVRTSSTATNGEAATQNGGDGLRKKPSFASFSPAVLRTSTSSPMSKARGANSPSSEELTMIRLKNAERRRVEMERRRREEREDGTNGG